MSQRGRRADRIAAPAAAERRRSSWPSIRRSRSGHRCLAPAPTPVVCACARAARPDASSRPDAETRSLENGAACKRMIERRQAWGHGVLRCRRERSDLLRPRERPGRALGRFWAGARLDMPVTILSGRLGGRQWAGGKSACKRADLSQAGCSHAPESFASRSDYRLRTRRSRAVATPRLEIGHCNDDMYGVPEVPGTA